MKHQTLYRIVVLMGAIGWLSACTASQNQPTATATPVPPTAVPAAKTITLATLEWPPYVGEGLEEYGFTSKIISEAFKRMGYEVTTEFMPWSRVLEEVEQGDFDAGYPAYFSEERAETYLLSEPFAEGPLGFYKRIDQDISYETLQDLTPYTIGVVRGYVNTPEFDAADYLQKEVANSDEQNLRKLVLQRLDLVVVDKFTAQYLINTVIPEATDTLEFLEPPLEVKPLYLIVSRQTENAEEKVADFNEGLRQIQEDGTLAQIMESYGFR